MSVDYRITTVIERGSKDPSLVEAVCSFSMKLGYGNVVEGSRPLTFSLLQPPNIATQRTPLDCTYFEKAKVQILDCEGQKF